MEISKLRACRGCGLMPRNTDQERKRPPRAENAADATLQSRICREKCPEMPFSLLIGIAYPSSNHGFRLMMMSTPAKYPIKLL